MNNITTIFITQSIGYNGNLLYYENILNGVYQKDINFKVFYPDNNRKLASGILLEKKVKLFRFKFDLKGSLYHYNVNLISPSFIMDLVKERPKKIIVSEFSIISLYVILYSLFFRVKIVQLIENDPKFVQKKHSFFRVLYRKLIALCVNKIVVNNKFGQEYCTTQLKVNLDKVHVLTYLTSEILPKENSIIKENEITTFLFVGQIHRRKGVFQLLEAISHLVHIKEIKKFKVIAVGAGKDLEKVKSLSKDSKIENNIEFIGRVNYAELSHYFKRSDVFMNLTLGDYRALVGFEALSQGLPLIYSKYDGAFSEVVINEKNGFIIDPKNIQEIINTMTYFINKPNEIVNFSNISKKIFHKYSFDSILKNWLQIIKL
jgi:glycosyltransferase involved in cell wall biosynthesis